MNHVHQAPVSKPQLRNYRKGCKGQNHKGAVFFRNPQLFQPEVQLLDLGIDRHGIPVAHKTGNPTIDACFDADRLDLGRVGVTPNPDRLATEKGKWMARALNRREEPEPMIKWQG